MKQILLVASVIILITACNDQDASPQSDSIIAEGQMPNLVKGENNSFHLVYGTGDSIMYSYSANNGKTFSDPALISVLEKLAASHTRGPQVAVTGGSVLVTACNSLGNIYSFTRNESGAWQQTARVNDMDTVAKENLMALSADGPDAFAVWLDLRDKHNKIFGAKSSDGGKTWGRNIMIYASPDSTVCECCRPSVITRGNQVYVMFRNWLNGNRDLYLIRSSDGGQSFGQAQKLGNDSWALDGCPMDGGGLAIDNKGIPQTVWNRKGKIYASEPGKAEIQIGEGRSCTIESVDGKTIYAWVEEGNIVVRNAQGMKKNLGKGQMPVIKAVDSTQLLSVWEKDRTIHSALTEL